MAMKIHRSPEIKDIVSMSINERTKKSLERVWKEFGKRLERVWKEFGKRLERVWKEFGKNRRTQENVKY